MAGSSRASPTRNWTQTSKSCTSIWGFNGDAGSGRSERRSKRRKCNETSLHHDRARGRPGRRIGLRADYRQDRCAERHVEPLCRHRRPRLGCRRQARGRRLQCHQQGHQGRDHQNKADVGSSIANQWFDVEKVDVIVDVPNSGVALALNEIIRGKNKVFINSGAASSDLTGAKCSPNTVHWTYDTWMLANGTGKAIGKTGGDTWFFLTADYAFGHALERDTAAVVEANGGKVVGKVRHPINTNDFSSFLLQAQTSKAKVIGMANAGGDT